MGTKGFVTIAAGDVKYYKLAKNLLMSYRYHTPENERYPFAVITNKENEYTELFDQVVVIPDLELSYMSKLQMLVNPPFDENVFIDADCLVYRNINELLNIGYNNGGGISAFGKCHDLGSQNGWYDYENLGEYMNRVQFEINMHGGILFFKNDEVTRSIYHTCMDIVGRYEQFRFKVFTKPADEPIMALSMAVHNCRPIDTNGFDGGTYYCFLPVAKQIKVNIIKGKLCYKHRSNPSWISKCMILHWQNYNTSKPIYKREVYRLYHGITVQGELRYVLSRIIQMIINAKYYIATQAYAVIGTAGKS